MRGEQPMRLSLVAMDTLDEFAALCISHIGGNGAWIPYPIYGMDSIWMLRDRANDRVVDLKI